jgi:hypothetical protein
MTYVEASDPIEWLLSLIEKLRSLHKLGGWESVDEIIETIQKSREYFAELPKESQLDLFIMLLGLVHD